MSTWAFIFLSCLAVAPACAWWHTPPTRSVRRADAASRMTATASDDDAIGLQRVQAALLNDAASAAALQGLLAQTLALFPSPSLPELGQAIEDARARLAVYKERGNSGDQDHQY